MSTDLAQKKKIIAQALPAQKGFGAQPLLVYFLATVSTKINIFLITLPMKWNKPLCAQK